MQTRIINLDEALKREYWVDNAYTYIWKQGYDKVELLPIERADDLVLENLLEARIFSERKELHLFHYEDGIRAVETEIEPSDEYREEKQLLIPRYGKNVTLRNYIAYEEDGQAYIARTVLCGCQL